MRGPAVDIVIPTYEGREHLESCLPSLREQTFRPVRVHVVDNGSGDGTAEWLERAHPDVSVCRLPANLGFSAAVNHGIRRTRAPYVALLNNDTVVDARWVEALILALEEEPQASFATSKILSARDPSVMDNAGDGFGRKGISYPIGYLEPDDGQYGDRRPVFGACGAACMFRRSLFEEVGLFDEDFFAYHEDADLSFRAQLAGHSGIYVPDAVVFHRGSATSGSRINAFTVFLSTRNNLHVLVKNLPRPLLLRYLPWILWGQAYWFLKMAVREGRWGPWTRGILAGFRDFRRMRSKRGKILGRGTVEVPSLDGTILASEREIRRSIARKRRARRHRR